MREDMQVGLQEEEEETWPKNAENSNLKRDLALNMAWRRGEQQSKARLNTKHGLKKRQQQPKAWPNTEHGRKKRDNSNLKHDLTLNMA